MEPGGIEPPTSCLQRRRDGPPNRRKPPIQAVYGPEAAGLSPASAGFRRLSSHNRRTALGNDRVLFRCWIEAFFGTRYETLKNVYDEVGPDDIRDAMTEAGMNDLLGDSGPNSEAQQRRISGGSD